MKNPVKSPDAALEIGTRLELFVDSYLIETLEGATLALQRPVEKPLAKSPLRGGVDVSDVSSILLYSGLSYRADCIGQMQSSYLNWRNP